MLEGSRSGSGAGSGSGSIPLNNGSGSRRPKNTWIRRIRIRIRIRNTAAKINQQEAPRAVIVSRLRAAGVQLERLCRPAWRSSSPGTTAGQRGTWCRRWTSLQYNKCSKKYGFGGLEVQTYVMRRGQSCRRQAREYRTCSRRTSRRCGTRRSGLPAHLARAFWTILCEAFLSYRPMQKPHNKIEDLIQNLKALMGSLNRDTLAKAC